MSMLHRLASTEEDEGGNPLMVLYAFRRYQNLGLDRNCTFAKSMPRTGASIKMIDYAIALLTIQRQIILNTNSLIKVSFGCTEIQYAQRDLDMATINEQRRRRGNDSYETTPDEPAPERRVHGNQGRVTDLAVNFITDTRMFIDHRTREEHQAGRPPHGHTETTENDPFPIFVSWTGVIVPDVDFEDPDNIPPIRLVGQPMTLNIGQDDPPTSTMGDRTMDHTLSTDPASLEIHLTDDPANRLSPDRTERQWGWFPPSTDAKVSVGDIRQRLQDLREGPGDTAAREAEIWRLLRDGRRITDRMNELLAARGSRSAAVEALGHVFSTDRPGPPRVYDRTDPWTRPRRQSW